MAGSLGQQDRAADLASFRTEHVDAFPLHRVPGEPAYAGQLQPSIGLDPADHRPERIHVGGHRPGAIIPLATPAGHQCPLTGAGEFETGDRSQYTLGQGDGRFS